MLFKGPVTNPISEADSLLNHCLKVQINRRSFSVVSLNDGLESLYARSYSLFSEHGFFGGDEPSLLTAVPCQRFRISHAVELK